MNPNAKIHVWYERTRYNWNHANGELGMTPVIHSRLFLITELTRVTTEISSFHDDVIKWRLFSALLALCAGNSPVTGESSSQRPVTRSFAVFFDLRLNKRLGKHSWGWWFDTPSHPLWRHCDVTFQFVSLGCTWTVIHIFMWIQIITHAIHFPPMFIIAGTERIQDDIQVFVSDRESSIRSRRVSVGFYVRQHIILWIQMPP